MITSLPPSPQVLDEKKTSYAMTYVATGKPIPNVTWYKQGNVTPLTESSSTVGIKFGTVNRGKAENWTCRTQNVAGIVESAVEIVVQCK